jgi:hypothetical protein
MFLKNNKSAIINSDFVDKSVLTPRNHEVCLLLWAHIKMMVPIFQIELESIAPFTK